jgi:hypothetical protein
MSRLQSTFPSTDLIFPLVTKKQVVSIDEFLSVIISVRNI